jgi:AcrR family transcriptional regulator
VTRPRLAVREPYDREQVTRTAARLFTERGYDGTSMARIAGALGIQKSSLYHHIAGKEQMLAEAVDAALDSLFAVLDEPEAGQGRALDRLEHVIAHTVQIMVERIDEVTLLLRVRGNSATEQRALERRREFDRRVQRLVELAVSEGDIRGDVDSALVTRLLFGMSNSVTEWYRPGRGMGAAEIADHILRICFEGLSRNLPGDAGGESSPPGAGSRAGRGRQADAGGTPERRARGRS